MELEEQTAEKRLEEQAAEIHHHQIHHPEKKETEVDVRQDDKDVSRNWNLPNLSKSRNLKSFLGNQVRISILGGCWFRSI